MQTLSDITIPVSALDFLAENEARLAKPPHDVSAISALLQSVTARHIQAGLDEATIHLVSATYDVTGEVAGDTALAFKSQIDRKTRTLVFANGLVRQGDAPILRATFVFRISV